MKGKIEKEVETKVEPLESSLKTVGTFKKELLDPLALAVRELTFLREDQDLFKLPGSMLDSVKSLLGQIGDYDKRILREFYTEREYAERGARESESVEVPHFGWRETDQYIEDSGVPVVPASVSERAQQTLSTLEERSSEGFFGKSLKETSDWIYSIERGYLEHVFDVDYPVI